MNFIFLHPAFLWGISAVFLPPVIHMLARRREKQMVFSSVIFLKEVARKTHSLSRITTLLLLLLRMLFLFFFALFLSAPVLAPANKPAATERSVVVVVLDASASMMRKNGTQTFFDAAKQIAAQKLSLLTGESRAALFFAKNPPLQKIIVLPQNKQSLQSFLNVFKPSYTKSHLTQALHTAVRYLQSQNMPVKELLVLSDFQKEDFTPQEISSLPGDVQVSFVQIHSGNKEAAENVHVGIFPSGQFFFAGAPQIFHLQRIATDGILKKNISFAMKTFFHKTLIAEKNFSLTVGAQKTFYDFTPSKPGFYCVQAQSGLYKADFPSGYLSSFCFEASKSLNVLVFENGSGDNLHRSNAYYVIQALKASQSASRMPVRFKGVTPDKINEALLSQFQTVILAGVPSLTQKQLSLLLQSIAKGQGLIVFAGDALDMKFYRSKFLPLFNVALKNPAVLSSPAFSFSVEKTRSPIFSSFPAENFQSAFSLHFTKALNIAALYPAEIPAVFNHSIPAIVESRYMKGKTVIINTSASPAFSNLALTAGFVPLLLNIILAAHPVSQKKINFSSDERNMKPGIYWKKTGKVFAVNLPFEEFRPSYSLKELSGLFPRFRVLTSVDYVFSLTNKQPSRNFSSFFLELALLVFLFETFLSSRAVPESAPQP